MLEAAYDQSKSTRTEVLSDTHLMKIAGQWYCTCPTADPPRNDGDFGADCVHKCEQGADCSDPKPI